MEHGNNTVMSGGNAVAQKIKYSGKEFQDELEFDVYDFGARNYDPALGRWFNIDPLAENRYKNSPYMYCNNNPIIFVDPDGMDFTLTGAAAQDYARLLQSYYDEADKTGNGISLDANTGEINNIFQELPELQMEGVRTPWGISMAKMSILFGNHLYSNSDVHQYMWDAWFVQSVHESFDIIGTVDPTGAFDLLHAGLYTVEGDIAMASISLAAILPAGDLLKGGKYINKLAHYEGLADNIGTRAYIKEFNGTSEIHTRILFNDITQGGKKNIINTPKGQIINATMSDGSVISLRNFSTKSGLDTHTTIQFSGSQAKWKFNY